jgi:hypothetical protein
MLFQDYAGMIRENQKNLYTTGTKRENTRESEKRDHGLQGW